jgi:hypothetical protein
LTQRWVSGEVDGRGCALYRRFHEGAEELLKDFLGEPAHLVLRGQVRDEEVDWSAVDGADRWATASVRSGLRPVMASCAPIAARPKAVAFPIPEVAQT